MHLVLMLAVLALVGWGIWQVLEPRAAFVIRVEDGQPRLVRGTATRAFLGEVRDLCRHHDVRRGTIRGQARGGRIGLQLRGPFPPAFGQQLRNVWALSGWSTGRGRG